MPSSPPPRPFIRKPLSHAAHFAGRFGGTYFITVCCSQRRENQLCYEHVARTVFSTAAMYHKRQVWYLILLLLMPDHLHTLVSISGDRSLARTIGNFKRATSKFAGIEWQRNFFDHRLRSDESLEGKAIYIRQNPVRAGLVKNERNWQYVMDRSSLDEWRFGKPPLPAPVVPVEPITPT
jgi:putative transposase